MGLSLCPWKGSEDLRPKEGTEQMSRDQGYWSGLIQKQVTETPIKPDGTKRGSSGSPTAEQETALLQAQLHLALQTQLLLECKHLKLKQRGEGDMHHGEPIQLCCCCGKSLLRALFFSPAKWVWGDKTNDRMWLFGGPHAC